MGRSAGSWAEDVSFANSSGKPFRYSGVDIDVTERKDAEARQALLVRELQHRGKNLLAVMQSIASNTLRSSKDVETAHDTLLGRLQALARAQEFIAAGPRGGAPIDEIVRAELEAFGGRVNISGPQLIAGNAFAQMFSVVVHELATNAVKYGALAFPEGRIDIRWAVDDEAGFSFEWIERGGPPVRPPTAVGFGSQLIQAALARGPPHSLWRTGLRVRDQGTSAADRRAADPRGSRQVCERPVGVALRRHAR